MDGFGGSQGVGGGAYREIGMERSGVGAGFEVGQDLGLFGRRGGSDDVHGVVAMGGQNDVVVDIDRFIVLQQKNAAVGPGPH